MLKDGIDKFNEIRFEVFSVIWQEIKYLYANTGFRNVSLNDHNIVSILENASINLTYPNDNDV